MVPTAQPLSSPDREPLGILALLAVTLVWGTTFLVMAEALVSFSACWLMTARFALAAVCLLPWAGRSVARLRQALFPGAWLGVLAFLGFVLQTKSLGYTTQAHCAFGTSLVTVFVPLLAAVTYKRRLIASTTLALGCAGLGMLALVGAEILGPADNHRAFTPDSMLLGDLLATAGAAAFAAQILLIERFSRRVPVVELVFAQIVCVCGLSLVGAWISGEPLPSLTHAGLGQVAYLGLAATAICLLGQVWGQARTSATRAAFIYAMEPAFAASLAWVFKGEAMTGVEIGGGVLMTLAAALAERPTPRFARAAKRRADVAPDVARLPSEGDAPPAVAPPGDL